MTTTLGTTNTAAQLLRVRRLERKILVDLFFTGLCWCALVTLDSKTDEQGKDEVVLQFGTNGSQ